MNVNSIGQVCLLEECVEWKEDIGEWVVIFEMYTPIITFCWLFSIQQTIVKYKDIERNVTTVGHERGHMLYV